MSTLQKLEAIPADWQAWLSYALMVQTEQKDLVAYLIQQGLSQTEAQETIELLVDNPIVLAGKKVARQLMRRNWLLDLYQRIEKQSLHCQQIERIASISREDFYKYYKSTNRPIILTEQIKDWKALQQWTPQYFKEQYGDRNIEVTYLTPELKHEFPIITMAEYIDHITKPDAYNGWYMSIANLAHNTKTIPDLYSEIDRLPELLNPYGKQANGYVLLGPKNTITDLHYDLANAIYCQIYGKKRFKIIAPHYAPYLYPTANFVSMVDLEHYDAKKWPMFEQVHVHEFTLNAGEMLFLPVGWWHYVVAEETSISVSFSNFYDNDSFIQYWDMYGKETQITD